MLYGREPSLTSWKVMNGLSTARNWNTNT